jgi:hypothetical protein
MPNISYEELAETKAQPLPTDASLESLKRMREDMCSTSASRDFKLQSNQRFLRRVMSPESPTRNLLMVHGTGVGKTCTAIQIAEEYIVRPEFQDKKVLVIANPSVQDNFKAQIFDITRVTIDADGLTLSKQCTGRRYLDMIQRSQSEPLRYTDKASQQRITVLANKLISEFYEFTGYASLANIIDNKVLNFSPNEVDKWIHDTFDNRLIIIDEAHNLKETSETTTSKLAAIALEKIIKTANGVTLVLLTATPMYDSYDEVLYYFNLFLWNERKLDLKKSIKPSEIFTETGDFKEGREADFRGWCQHYISYVRGENPFTFPFRLPPPSQLIAVPDRKTDVVGKPIAKQRQYLTLTQSIVSSEQSAAIKPLMVQAVSDSRLICMFPENKSFRETFDKVGTGYKYHGEKFLAPSTVARYSSKFALIMNSIASSTGLVFVYSNIVESGAQLFAMCLEEHGYSSASGDSLLKETTGEVKAGSVGKYVIFTSYVTDSEIKKALIRLKRPENADGSDIRVIIASPKVSEGVDFRFIRQIHILDPWFNMSRIEQVLGRGMRTCSHSLLPFEQQNCTVYLHVCRYPDSDQETVDEYIYRVFVEEKAVKIAKVKRVIMESAMDCTLQDTVNSLPPEWREALMIPQIRNEDKATIELSLSAMSAPTFEEGVYGLTCKVAEPTPDPDHERPLSAILDVKDEILDKVLKLFAKKPVWKKADLFGHTLMRQYTDSVLSYILQNAVDSGFKLVDKNGRSGHLQTKNGVFAFTIGERDTLLDRLLAKESGVDVDLPVHEPEEEPVQAVVVPIVSDLAEKRTGYAWPAYIKDKFEDPILDWYLVDNVLTEKEKFDHLLGLDWSSPPIYAAPLIFDGPAGKMIVLGSKKIYNTSKEKITPVGEEQDAYQAWLKRAKDTFVSKKDQLFASIKEGVIIFNLDGKAKTIQRAARTKTIGGMACTSYSVGFLDMFSTWLVGEPFPANVKTKEQRCIFLNLLIRKAIASGKEGIFWITPEEFLVFSDDDNRPDLIRRLK